MPQTFPLIRNIPTTASNLEKDAQLALSMLLFFDTTQDRNEGMWRDGGPSATLRLTCHILESLYLLHQDAMRSTIDSGLTWLMNLSDGLENGHLNEDRRAVCEHPSRFKTLIWLHNLSDPEIRAEFQSLGDRIGPDGLLHGTSLDPKLATLIFLDSLLLLPEAEMPTDLRKIRSQIVEIVHDWVAQMETPSESRDKKQAPSAVLTQGQLSYAVDLMLRAEKVETDWLVSHGHHQLLIDYVLTHLTDRPLDSDVLYCAIQLATHFGDMPSTQAAVERLLERIRQKYYREDLRKESSSFHPLVMRLLVAFHGPQIEAEVLGLMLRRERTHYDQGVASQENQRRSAFQEVIKRRIQIGIQGETPLTGGITKAKVFRVKFHVHLHGLGEERASSTSISGDFNSMVIKVGTLDLLLTSIENYRRLPSAVKPYFATHSGPIGPLPDSHDGQAYLILEDLTDKYETFRSVVDRYDRRSLAAEHRNRLYQACDLVLSQLFEIYDHTRESASAYTGFQVYRIYLSRLERALIEGAKRHSHLKTWYQGFWLNGEFRFPAIEYYHRKLDRFKAKLRVPNLTLVHGDCHTRNIMVDDCFEQIKLIDLDRTTENGDYIQDIALLFEDIAIFRFIFDEDYPYYLESEKVHFPSHDEAGIENKIVYDPLTSRSVVSVQQHMMGFVESYATRIQDTFWRERLWLAIAVHLLRLMEKHDDPKLATVLYVEAIKLLDRLDRALESGIHPPGIPFPGTHAITEEGEGEAALWPTLPEESRTYLRSIHREILNSTDTLRFDINRTGTSVHYFVNGVTYPVLAIYGDRSPIQMLMAADPTALDDPRQLASPKESRGALRTVVELSGQADLAYVSDLILQTIKFVSETGHSSH